MNSITRYSPFIYVSTVRDNKITQTKCFNIGNEDNVELMKYKEYVTTLLQKDTMFIVYGVKDKQVVLMFATHDEVSSIVESININDLKSCNLAEYGQGAFGKVQQNATRSGLVVKTPVDYLFPFKRAMARSSINQEHHKLMLLNNIDQKVREQYTLLLPRYNATQNANSSGITFKHCNGKNLIDVLEDIQQKDNEKQERLRIAIQFIEALLNVCDELFKLGYSHCDIKPNNIMLCKDDVKVIDFGNISKNHFSCNGTPMFYPENAIVFLTFLNQYKGGKSNISVSPKTMHTLQSVAQSVNYKGAGSSTFARDLYAIGLTLAIIYPYDDNEIINDMVEYLVCQDHNEFVSNNKNPFQTAIEKWNHLKAPMDKHIDGGRKQSMYTKYNNKRFRICSGKRNALYINVGTKKVYLSSINKNLK